MTTSIGERVAALHEQIRDEAPRIAIDRRLPAPLVDDLRSTGVFDVARPAAWGGAELDPLTQYDVFEGVAVADASVGWCAMIGADSGYYPAFLDDTVGRDLYPGPGLVTAGATGPGPTVATKEGDGWRVDGQWSFGSGSTHADLFVGGVFLHESDGTPLVDAEGLPVWRTAFLPRDSVEVLDTWDTVGLRGTASNDYRCEPVFVPDEHLFDVFGETRRDEPLYRLPWWFVVKVTPVCTGIARHAIDEAVAIAEGKTLLPELTSLLERPGTAATIARAEGRLRAARAFVLDEMATVWEACCSGGDLSRSATVGLRLAMTQAAHDSLEVTRQMVDLVTTAAIGADSTLARLHADATVAATHLAHNHRAWEPLGRRLLDLPLGQTAYI